MNLPNGWTETKIGDIAEVNPGLPRKVSPEETVTFLGMADVGIGEILTPQERTANEVSSGFTQFANGDILIGKITPCFENGKGGLCSNLSNGVGFGSTEFIVLRPKANADAGFLLYHSLSEQFRSKGESNMVGSAGQRRLQPGFVRSYSIPLPPLGEQRAIAQLLARWDEALRDLTQLIEAKARLKRALMQQLLAGKRRFAPFQQPWKTVAIGEVLQPTSRLVQWDEDELYQLASIRRNAAGLFWREALKGHQIKVKKLHTLREGDFLISHIQAAYGAMGRVPAEFDGGKVSDMYSILTPIQAETIDVRFLDYLSQMPAMKHQAYLACNGFFAERLRLNFDPREFFKQHISLPPTLEEQRRIAEVLDGATREIQLLEAQRAALARQKRGLMARLLSGQTRLNGEESA